MAEQGITQSTPDALDVDVLVIGSGAAGLSTALSAHERGLSVLVVEKRPHLGGTSARSGGWIWVPGNKVDAQDGEARVEALGYIEALAAESFDREAVERFLDNVPEALEFFERRTDLEFVYGRKGPDYRQEAPHARSTRALTVPRLDARALGDDRLRVEPYLGTYTVFGYMPEIGHDIDIFLRANRSIRAFLYVAGKMIRTWTETILFRRSFVRTNGNALYSRLVLTARRFGIPMWTEAAAERLLTDAGGRVTGAVIVGKVKEVVVTARQGVVLATGGFGNNRELRKQLFPHDRSGDNHFTATVGHDGDAVRLAGPLGTAISNRPHQPAAWAPVTVWKDLRGRRRIFPHLRAFGMPGLIAVNAQGERFANESFSYHDFGIEMQQHATDGDEVRGYIIADGRAMHRYGIGYAKPWPFPSWYFRRVGFLVRARTLDELAARIQVPADRLKSTIAQFNKGARVGEDPQFHRGSTWFHHFKGDMSHKPNPNLAPLDRPYYYAAPIRVGDLGTYAGLPIGSRGEVLRTDGGRIDGLYAVGTAAESVFGGGYPGYGAVLGPAMVLGYAVGRDLANATKDDEGGAE